MRHPLPQVLVTMSIIRDDAGAPQYFQCSAVPTVERVAAEGEDAAESSRLFGDLFQGALVDPMEVLCSAPLRVPD
jgi:hypothetical protein